MDYKQTLILKEADFDSQEHSLVAVLSREAVDHDKDVLLLSGVDLARFQSNPIAFLNHDRSKRIGRWAWIKQRGQELIGKLLIAGSDAAESAWRELKAGTLRGVSVGFSADDQGPPTPAERAKWPGAERIVRRWTLLEASLVSIPSNADALVETVSKCLGANDLKAVIAEKVAEAARAEFYSTEFPAMIADALDAALYEATGVVDQPPLDELKSDLAALFVSGPPEITPEVCSTISEILTRHVEGAIQSAIATCR